MVVIEFKIVNFHDVTPKGINEVTVIKIMICSIGSLDPGRRMSPEQEYGHPGRDPPDAIRECMRAPRSLPIATQGSGARRQTGGVQWDNRG